MSTIPSIIRELILDGELNLKTIVLEKTGLLGGSRLLCGGQFSTFGTDLQKAKRKTDTADIFYNDMIKTDKGMNDPKVVRAFVDMSKIQYDFLTKTLDVHTRGIMAASSMSVPRSHTFNPPEVIKALTKYAKVRGVEIVLNAKANRLVTECGTGRVIRVKATINKKDVVLDATKGVILAAGGFSRNPELLVKFNPIMAKADVISGDGTQGDGILMAADTLDTTYIKASYGFKLKPTIIQDISLITYSGTIMINKEGTRFTDEAQSYKLQGDASLAQTDGYSYQLFDKNILDYDLKNDTQGVEMMTALTNDPAGQK